MKFLISICFILSLFNTCFNFENSKGKKINANTEILKRRFPEAKRLILFSCVRCGCFVDLLNNLSTENNSYLQQQYFITDSNCNKINLPIIHLPQKIIDSISVDIYNLTLVKRIKNKYEFRIIETEETDNWQEISKSFFDTKK